jgi:hypothetical protein
MTADNDGCRCWDYSAALGHEGHCCFLRDDRNEVRHSEAWRALEDICHVPQTHETAPQPEG